MAAPQPTSIESYLALLPKLGDKQWSAFTDVLRFLHNNPSLHDITGTELNEFTNSPSSHKRLSELGRMGLMEMSQVRLSIATVSGATEVQAWKPTWSCVVLPLKDTPPPAIPKHKQRLIEILREITKDWCCCCRPGSEKCYLCRVEDVIENR